MAAGNQHLTVEERRERKRLQNRLHQRARSKTPPPKTGNSMSNQQPGQRIKKDENNENPQKSPYRVDRWRLDEFIQVPSETPIPVTQSLKNEAHDAKPADDGANQSLHSKQSQCHQVSDIDLYSPSLIPTQDSKYPLPVDHCLITLISQNVCRGIQANKNLLQFFATFIDTVHNIRLPPESMSTCQISVIRPSCQTMPPCLQPTQLQMNLPHPSWMDVLPFPEVRDNLIRNQEKFDHVAFLEDLVGDMVYTTPSYLHSLAPWRMKERRLQVESQGEADDKSLILWGEPHLKESWEATPRFLTKWAWVAEGCRDLVRISDTWRASRGENSLRTILNS